MTLTTNSILPLNREKIISGGEDLYEYMRELVISLEDRNNEVSEGVNGSLRNYVDQGSRQFIPVLDGSTTGTFTYVHQVAWVLRQGLIVDYWGDVQWSGAGTAAGNLLISLPYKVAITAESPFIGSIHSDNVTFTAGTSLTIEATSDSYIGEILTNGNGVPSGNQSVVPSGRISFYIRYVGQGKE